VIRPTAFGITHSYSCRASLGRVSAGAAALARADSLFAQILDDAWGSVHTAAGAVGGREHLQRALAFNVLTPLFWSTSLVVVASKSEPGYSTWRVGRNRISFMSTSSGWLMAKTTARANESAEIAKPA